MEKIKYTNKNKSNISKISILCKDFITSHIIGKWGIFKNNLILLNN